MRRILVLVLILILAGLFYQLFGVYRDNRGLSRLLSELNQKEQSFQGENSRFLADLEYFSNPDNLEKELRSRFNFKKPGEKLIIVVPPKNPSQ